jgi:hypothetical protein
MSAVDIVNVIFSRRNIDQPFPSDLSAGTMPRTCAKITIIFRSARRRRKGLEAKMIFPHPSLYIHVYVYNRHMGHGPYGPGWSYYILYTPLKLKVGPD